MPAKSPSLVRPNTGLLLQMMADWFQAMGEPIRLRIVCVLQQGELSGQALMEMLPCPKQTTSRHLAVLRQAGIIRARREGHATHFRVADAFEYNLCGQVFVRVREEIASRSLAVGL